MGQIYFADTAVLPSKSQPNAAAMEDSFIATLATMLLQTGAAGFLIGDVICLAPIPGGCTLQDYEVNIPELDTGSAVTFDLGDNQILAAATSGTVGTAFTTPALGTSFTLTAAASTASFTATNGLLMVNGILIGYASLSGSTFVTCYSSVAGVVIPKGSLIQQAGNTAAYQAIAAVQAGSGIVLLSWGSVSSTTVATATAVPSAIPAGYSSPFNTTPPPGTPNPVVPAIIGQQWLTLKIHASPTTYNAATTPITGRINYTMRGYYGN
jgi:hypothetical protein